MWGTGLTENLLLNRNIAVTIRGGYNAAYSAVTGETTVQGSVTVSKGSLTVDGLVVK